VRDVVQTHLSHDKLLDAMNPGAMLRYLPRLLDKPRLGAPVHQLLDGRTQEPKAGKENHAAGEEGRPIVGDLVAPSADQRDGDPDRGQRRSERVGPVMPGIGVDRSAPDMLSDPVHALEETSFTAITARSTTRVNP